MKYDRRSFLSICVKSTLGMLFPMRAFASLSRPRSDERTLRFYNAHTGESLETCYYCRGHYQTNALKEINHILRDHYSGEIMPIHRDLLDLLVSISLDIGDRTRFHVISGYRSPKTNEMLRRITSGVAKNSLHMKGMAIDIRVLGLDTKQLRNTCMNHRRGGVGYYPKSNFVHVDVGQVRYWSFTP